jgi:hypothetical protein
MFPGKNRCKNFYVQKSHGKVVGILAYADSRDGDLSAYYGRCLEALVTWSRAMDSSDKIFFGTILALFLAMTGNPGWAFLVFLFAIF